MQINMAKQVPVDVKEIRVHIKVCDRFDGAFVDAQGETLRDYEGYVPDFFPGDHYGDYLILNIDLETGQILNWKKPTAEDVEAYIGGTSED